MQHRCPHLVELYEVIAEQTHTLTTSRQSISWRDREWTPAAIERSDIKAAMDGKPATVTLTACMDTLLTRYLAALPIVPTKINIYEHEPESGNTLHIYSGIVTEVAPNADATHVTARCSSSSPILDAMSPGMIYSGQCQFVLFDAGCGLPRADWSTVTRINVDGTTLTSPDFAARPDGWFTRGVVAFAHDFRFIAKHTGDTLTLQLPFDGRLRNGMEVTVSPGCDGSPATCQDRFSNSHRFGGCASIPSRNPVVWGFR